MDGDLLMIKLAKFVIRSNQITGYDDLITGFDDHKYKNEKNPRNFGQIRRKNGQITRENV